MFTKRFRCGAHSFMNVSFTSLFLLSSSYLLAPRNAQAQTQAQNAGGPTAVDPKLKLNSNDEVSPIFEGVVAVQRKAKVKANSFLVNPMFSYDFSDAPYTQYALMLNLGYAISDYWEVYATYAPSFIANERNLAKQIKKIGQGQNLSINAQKPKSYMGIAINWLPIYGKDSWGPYSIVRSDTFIHFSAGQIEYTKDPGNKFTLALGKTFFFSDMLNVRVQAGPSFVEGFSRPTGATKDKKESYTIGVIETGLVFYF